MRGRVKRGKLASTTGIPNAEPVPVHGGHTVFHSSSCSHNSWGYWIRESLCGGLLLCFLGSFLLTTCFLAAFPRCCLWRFHGHGVPASEASHDVGGNPLRVHRAEVGPRPRGVVLSWAPRIFQFDGVLSAHECDSLAAKAMGRMGPVGTFSDASERSIRTSSSMWFSSNEDDADELVASVRRAMLDIVLVPSAYAESLQVTRYDEGQYYDLHYDFSQPGRESADPAKYPFGDVERTATVIAYLSDGFEGGETVFPRVPRPDLGNGAKAQGLLDKVPGWNDSVWPRVGGVGGVEQFCSAGDALRVKPAKGSVLVFYGYGANGVRDMDTIHGSCPVVKSGGGGGVKIIAQQWVQMNIGYASKQTLEDRWERMRERDPAPRTPYQPPVRHTHQAAKDAIATLVSTREYALGAVVLARTLRATNRAVKTGEIALVALVPPHGVGGREISDLEAGWMEHAGWKVVRVECLTHVDGHNRGFLRPDLASVSYSKLHLWTLVEYDRVVFIDADALVTGDVGHLLDNVHWAHADKGFVFDLNGVEEVNGQVKTGLFGIRPSIKTHRKLLKGLRRNDINFTNNEQGFVSAVLRTQWGAVPAGQRMPGDEHLCSGACGMRLPVWAKQVASARVVDFQGLSKPWTWPHSIAKQECQVMVVFALLWQALLFAPCSQTNTKDVGYVLSVFSSVRHKLVSHDIGTGVSAVDPAGVQQVAGRMHGLLMEMVERIGECFIVHTVLGLVSRGD